MLSLLAAISVLQSPSHPDAVSLIRQMLDALQPVAGVQMTIESEPTLEGHVVPYKAVVRAAIGPDRYWAKCEGGAPIGTEFVAWDGKAMRYTGDAGNRAVDKNAALRVVENYASQPAFYGWKMFFDRDKYRDALRDGALYVHEESVEGHECDVVALSNHAMDHGEERAAVQYLWLDRQTHLPRAYQLHFFNRGKADTIPKMLIEDLEVNPVWTGGPFSDVPAHVTQPAVSPATDANKLALKTSPELVSLKSGAAIPDLDVQDLKYRTVKLRSLIHGPTLVAFWAPWCGPCVRELEALKSLPKVKNGSVRVIAVAVFDSKEHASRYAQSRPLPYTFVIDPDSERSRSRLATAFGVSAIPHAYLCGAHGLIVREWMGFTDAKTLAAELSR